ncbi:MAG: DUF3369 domain-containing protein [Roseibium sp.]|nr:DUF3369 domain-containing protein [Roseibium sp.]
MKDQGPDIFFSEPAKASEVSGAPWKVLVVDDEQSVHDVTRLALSDFRFEDRGLDFISAYSGEEARKAILEHPDTAIILLDVVMETETAGLEVAHFVREVAHNKAARIVLRTGQPGQAPEKDVIAQYDINDYKEKTELTSRKLSTLMYASLRSFRDIVALEKNKSGLEAVIEASAKIFKLKSKERFAEGVLEQVSMLLKHGYQGPDVQTDALAVQYDGEETIVTAATGAYRAYAGAALTDIEATELRDIIEAGRSVETSTFSNDSYTGHIHFGDGINRLLYLKGLCCEPAEMDRSLLKLVERNIAIACENIDLLQEIEQTQNEMIYLLGETIETRSMETGHHVQRVAEISRLLALEYGLGPEEAEVLRMASPLHDIGKIGISDAILNKPGKLDAQEWDIMKTHTSIGYDMLKSSRRRVLQAGAIIARDHHEKWAGGGYPANKRGDEIHLYGRITAVADVFDALGSERSYKHAWPLEDILDLMRAERGRHFEPRLVDILLENINEIQRICQSNKD